MYIDEFPHDVVVRRTKTEIDRSVYPPKEVKTITEDIAAVFMDTPSTSERLNMHNLDITLDRNMYAPFGTDIERSDVIIYDSIDYEPVGDLEDQGGQHEIVKLPLKRK